jgi:type 1 fimbria pilin
MLTSLRRFSIAVASLALVASAASAADRCVAKANIAGKSVVLKNCAVALYDNSGVTLWFTDAPLSAAELSTFQLNSDAKTTHADNRMRTMLSLAFCPGGGKATASAAAVKSVEIVANEATPGAWQSFVFALPGDKANLKVEKLTGELKTGGRLAGRITGGKREGERPYSWDVDFDVALPAKTAAAGPGCS